MQNRTEALIQEFLSVHTQMNNVFKNIKKIDFQYNAKLQTVATILENQTKNKNEVYKHILTHASNADFEITEEGYDHAVAQLRKYKQQMVDSSLSDRKNVIQLAMNFTNLNIIVFEGMLDLLKKYEKEKGIVHPSLKENLELLLRLETRDLNTLESFQRK